MIIQITSKKEKKKQMEHKRNKREVGMLKVRKGERERVIKTAIKSFDYIIKYDLSYSHLTHHLTQHKL